MTIGHGRVTPRDCHLRSHALVDLLRRRGRKKVDVKIYDISYTLHEGLPAWPGDWKFRREVSSSISNGQDSNSSNISTALHCGTHLDAPLHSLDEGLAIDQVALGSAIGPALVISVKGPVIIPDELREAAEKKSKRVMLPWRKNMLKS